MTEKKSLLGRIVILTNDNQIDRRILSQAKSLTQVGWQITIIAAPKDLASKDNNEDFTIVRVSGAKSTSKRQSILTKFRLSCKKRLKTNNKIYGWLRSFAFQYILSPEKFYKNLFLETALQYKADIYFAHDLALLPVASECAKKNNAKLAYDSHELFAHQEVTSLESKIWHSIEEKHIHQCQLVITVNPTLADILQKTYHLPEVYSIENAVESQTNLNNLKIFHHKFDLPEESYVLLYQGRLLNNRHLEALIKSMDYVDDNQIHLVLLADGDAKPRLKEIARLMKKTDHIHFHPAVSQDDLIHYTASADAGIIPYQDTCLNIRYCTPNKLYEYIAAGIPTISTDLPEIAQMNSKYQLGILGKTQTPAQIATLINQLFSDPELLKSAKAKVRESQKSLNWENEGKKLQALFNKLVG